MAKVIDREALKRQLNTGRDMRRFAADKRRDALSERFGADWEKKETMGAAQHREYLDAAKARGKAGPGQMREELIKRLLDEQKRR